MRFRIAAVSCLAAAFAGAVVADVPVPRFARTVPVASEPVVADAATRLQWQGCPAGMIGDLYSCSGTAYGMTWQSALDYCQDSAWAGLTDWYLPSIAELNSSVDDRAASPAIDSAAFPSTPAAFFWSSTSLPANGSIAWGINFAIGNAPTDSKTRTANVRCVRREL